MIAGRGVMVRVARPTRTLRTRPCVATPVSNSQLGKSVATTFADLEARIRGPESRAQRAEEDITAIIGTVIETRDDVKWLNRAVQALLDHNGVQGLAPDEDA